MCLSKSDEQSRLLVVRWVVDDLAHAIDRHLVRLDPHQRRIVHVLVGKFQHTLRERRREQHVEPLIGLRQPAQDVANVADEAEIEHAIGLIQHQHLHRSQVDDALLGEIDDAARRPHQDVDALFELMLLFFVVDAAKRESEPEARVRSENFRVAMDLNGQFARWSDDQGARRIESARRRRRLAHEPRVHRDEKCCGFPGSCLRLPRDIEAGERVRQCLRLDRRAAFERSVRETLLQRFRQMQTGEGEIGQVRISHSI